MIWVTLMNWVPVTVTSLPRSTVRGLLSRKWSPWMVTPRWVVPSTVPVGQTELTTGGGPLNSLVFPLPSVRVA